MARDAHAVMRNIVKIRIQNLTSAARHFLQHAREWSRPVRVVGHAIADLRKSKVMPDGFVLSFTPASP